MTLRRGIVALLVLAGTRALVAQVTVHPALPDDLPSRLREALGAEARPAAARDGAKRHLAPGTTAPEDPERRDADPEGRPSGGIGAVRVLLWILFGAAAIAGARLLLVILRTRRSPRAPPAAAAAPPDAGTPDLGLADALLAGGRRRSALRAFYLAGVAAARARAAGKGELADAALAAHLPDGGLRSAFMELSRRFQPVHYGGREPGAADLAAARRAARIVVGVEPAP